MREIKKRDPENMFVFTNDTTPHYMKKEKSEEISLTEEDEDVFQEL